MCGASDRERLTAWVRDFGDGLHRYLRIRVRDEHLAADLVQEVFFRAWRSRHRYEDRSQDRAYLFAIADRLACDVLRAPRCPSVLEADLAAADADPAEVLAKSEDFAVVRNSLDELSDQQRRTLLLRFFGGMSFQQIAETLGCPLGTALSHCRRGLERLRESLAEVLV